MPYIKKSDRAALDDAVAALAQALPRDKFAGQLNYAISKLCASLIEPKSYARLNEIIGALECAKLELYRRVAAPYEDAKAKENGDVY